MQNNIKLKFKKIQKILSEEWDPIPGAPLDEYDDYINQIISFHVNKNLTIKKLTEYLMSLEEGFSNPINTKQTTKISEEVMAILIS